MKSNSIALMQKRFLTGVSITLVTVSAAAGDSRRAGKGLPWPGFRGPNADGVSTDKAVFHSSGDFRLRTAWKNPLGSGYSGVAVARGFAVTMFSDETSDIAIAFDAKNGEERWRFNLGPTYTGHDGSHTGPISTPLIALRRVFGLSPRGRLFALDLRSGRLLWSTDLVKDHGAVKPHYGFATSPIHVDGVLVVQLGAKDAAIAGFNPFNGHRLWSIGSDEIGYQSPVLVRWDKRMHVVAAGEENLYGIDAGNGKLLWKYAHEGGGARGVASLVPVPAGPGRLFLAYKDNASCLVEFSRGDDATVVEKTWEDRSIRNSYNVPVYHDGYIYAYSSRFLTCVDAKTGKSMWRSRQPGDGFLILVDSHLVIVTKKGTLHVVKATPSGYQEAARLSLFSDLAWSIPSFANRHIYLRSLGEIARVDIRLGAARQKPEQPVDKLLAGSRFGRFLSQVRSASDKKAVVDHFMSTQKVFPLIEGEDLVHFVYRGPGEDLAVGSDLFGARQERPMTRLKGTDFFHYSTRLEPDARVNYLFFRDYEELTDPLNPRKTTTTVYGKEMEISFGRGELEMSWMAMPKWKAPVHLDEPDPSRRGRIETQELECEVLKKKHSIDVYLPAGYGDGKRRYPVAYVHGGQQARERGQVPRALDNLISKRVEPVIAVFINEGLSPFGGPDKYANMFFDELIPFVDKKYRTIRSAGARASVGSGFAGFAAFYCAFNRPKLIGKVGGQSLFMFDTMKQQLEEQIPEVKEDPIRIYLEWGKYDFRNPHEAWDLAEANRHFAHLLREKGHTPAGGEVHDGTGWSSWRNRTDDLFETLFPIAGASKQ